MSRSFWSWLEQTAPAARLGILRAAIGGYALWYVSTRRDMIAEISRDDPSLFDPVGPFWWMTAPLDPSIVDWMVFATIVAGCAFVLGALYRVTGPLFGLLLLLTLCYRNSWSMVYHTHNLLVLHVLILGFARAADGVSVDSRLRRRPVPDSVRYGWPIALICAVTAAGYFVTGAAKVFSESGFSWASGIVLREQIGADAIRKHVLEDGAPAAAYALYDQVWLFTTIGVLTLTLELGAPVFMATGRLRRSWAVGAWLMHWGVLLIMGIKFRYQLSFITFLPFFHVERVGSLVRSAFARYRQVVAAVSRSFAERVGGLR